MDDGALFIIMGGVDLFVDFKKSLEIRIKIYLDP